MHMPEAVVVAKKKAIEETGGRKPMIAQLRGDAKYKAWIERAARFDNRSVAGFIERSVARYAKEIGFDEEAPDR
jgi:uncharacterized protein (DUF1778 family)